jgi:sialate O-acetylesterase
MIAPLVPYAIRGAIWYQGETNAGANQAYLYRYLFQTMILDWRSRWAQGDFPFLFVQLANYAKTAQPSGWPELRESQRRALDLRNTGMAVITDIGEAGDIHPRNKQDVGLRLALAARALVYGEKLTYSGPLFRQMTKEGNCLRLWFDHASGLAARGGGELRGFTVAGLDRVFHPARAVIEKDSVVVSAEAVTDPLAARYAWADDPENNLVNSEGLPASPFRTDDWRNARMP